MQHTATTFHVLHDGKEYAVTYTPDADRRERKHVCVACGGEPIACNVCFWGGMDAQTAMNLVRQALQEGRVRARAAFKKAEQKGVSQE